MSVTYIILVGLSNPVDSNILSHPNGTRQVFSVKSDADETLSKINKLHGENYARLVAV